MARRHGGELRARGAVVLEGGVGEEVEGRGGEGGFVGRVEVHERVAWVVCVGVFVEVDAVVGG